jgi:hypothetical protein
VIGLALLVSGCLWLRAAHAVHDALLRPHQPVVNRIVHSQKRRANGPSAIADIRGRQLAPIRDIDAERQLNQRPCFRKFSHASRRNRVSPPQDRDAPVEAIRPGCPSVANGARRAALRIEHQPKRSG